MKFFARWSLLGSGIGLIFLTATPSFATVVGNLFTGGSGTVTVTATSITFNENDSTVPPSSTEVGTGTTLTFDGGSLMPGQPIDINGGMSITGASLPVANFMTFPDSPSLSVTLDSFGPGSANHNCSGLTTGESCSPLIGGVFPSPIILTYTGAGIEGSGPTNVGVSALLEIGGTATDASSIISIFTGHFSSSIADETPAQLAALFAGTGASFTTTYAGDFIALPPSTVPEPRFISMLVMAGLLMGLVVAKRRKSVA